MGTPHRDFEWKESAGATFYIRCFSRRLTWEDVSNILWGLKQEFYDEFRYFTTSSTVEDQPIQQFIGLARLNKYRPLEPSNIAAVRALTS